MSKSMRAAERSNLHMQWIEQFLIEAEQAVEQENVKTTAQTVLFHAGLQANTDCLLTSEEEIVHTALQLTPEPFHRLLQLSLRTVIEKEISYSPEDLKYMHTYSGLYISWVKEQADRLAAQWLH
jgi:hypothetical protein